MKYTFGADPELFVFTRRGKLIPAYDLIPDTGKGKTLPFGPGAIHSDNIMLELNPFPGKSFEEVWNNCNIMRRDFEAMFGVKTSARSEITIINSWLRNLRKHYKFYEFGCDPDVNAYLMDINFPHSIPDNLRMAGGHVMISGLIFPSPSISSYSSLVQNIDKYLKEVPNYISLNHNIPLPSTRPQYYGALGNFRIKNFDNIYGVEYRTLGPEWLDAPETISIIEKGLIAAVEEKYGT